MRILRPQLGAVALVVAIGCGDGSNHTDLNGSGLERPAFDERHLASPLQTAEDTSPGPLTDDSPGPRGPIRFRELTETGIDFVHTSGVGREKYFPTGNGSGVAALDYDLDGRLDLYFATERNLPLTDPNRAGGSRLYRNLGGGRFEDVTEAAGVGFAGFTHGVAAADVDGDGFPDLFLANYGPNVLYMNNGDGSFRDATAGSGLDGLPWSSGGTFLDHDRDGCLDLYVTCYGEWSFDRHLFCGDAARNIAIFCSPLTIKPVSHRLFRNRGDGTFEDVTSAAGVDRSDGRGFSAVAADINRDGLIDLYVANDLSPNYLFLNRGDGTFEDLTDLSGAAKSDAGADQGSMGIDAVDLDDDGLPELFVSNFFGEPNTLYHNLGGSNFQDISAVAGIVPDSMPDVGWGCALDDLDNDGLPDMIVFNGHLDDSLPALNHGPPQAEPSRIWRNMGGMRFELVRNAGPFFTSDHVARGATFADLDDDGDTDVAVSLLDKTPAVLQNESESGHWIGFDLVGRASNRTAIGAMVELQVGDRVIYRQLRGGASYVSSLDPRVRIGLGAAAEVARAVVHWPSGATTTLVEPEVGRYHLLREIHAEPVTSESSG